ncbi:hypothetical protein LE181_04745 [Streptomyces sp. SCA3-4]|uniref:daptide-type RiPP n=1 Tax=Streptomyces sichuanensis TaxID=2871810 RepID=UPI001CE25AE6|nr:daptide-type RiPP [Streptomyces sichuanensis]MCA6091474.1 hypothetical protein [Streptomyces sichuanensis]
MQENFPMEAAGFEPVLELGLQELEAMEAPGWWTVGAVASAVGSAALSIASVIT